MNQYYRKNSQFRDWLSSQLSIGKQIIVTSIINSSSDRHSDTDRKAGEEWLVRKTGSYLPAVDEQVSADIRLFSIFPLSLHEPKTFKFIVTRNTPGARHCAALSGDAHYGTAPARQATLHRCLLELCFYKIIMIHS